MNNSIRPIFRVAAGLGCLLTGAPAQSQETQPAQPVQPQPTQAPSSRVELPKSKKRRLPLFGPQIESNVFFSSKTRNRFHSDSLNFNFGIGDPTPSLKGSVLPDVSVTIARHTLNGDKNKLFVISLGPEYRQAYIPSKIKRLIKQLQASQANGALSGAPPTNSGPTPPGFPPPGGFPTGAPPIAPYYGVGVNLLYANIKSPLEASTGQVSEREAAFSPVWSFAADSPSKRVCAPPRA